MRISSHHRGLVVTVAGALLLVVGFALALAKKPTPPPKRSAAKTPSARGTLDCKLLERQLSKCGPAIAAAFDSGLGGRLAKQPPLLREAVLRTISQEFASRVAGPCFARKGKLDQGAQLQACLTAAEKKAKATACSGRKGKAKAKCVTAQQLTRCRTLATCLAAKVRALPRPKKKKTAAGMKPAAMKPAAMKPAAAMKATPAKRPAPKKK